MGCRVMDRRIQKTKAAIRGAYFELLREKNTSRVTVAELARRANIDRKTFYLHYETTDDILREFSRDKIQELLFLLERDDFFERPFDIASLFGALNLLIEENLDFYRYAAGNENWNLFWSQVQEILIGTMREVYADAVELTGEEFTIYARYTASGVLAAYRSWLKGEIPVSMEELARVTGRAAFFGIQSVRLRSGGEPSADSAGGKGTV